MTKFSLRAEGLYDEALDTLIDLPDDAAAERAAIQMLTELRINASAALARKVRRIAVHDAHGAAVMNVTLTVTRPPAANS